MNFPKFNLLGDLGTSLIRTGVPLVAGVLVSWAVRHGFSLQQAEVTGWLTPVASFGYYATARRIEHSFPQFGWLLGVAKLPSYASTSTATTTPVATTTATSGVVDLGPDTSAH